MATDKTVTKHLILLKIQNMMDIEGVLLQCFIGFLIKDCKWGCWKSKYIRPAIRWRITNQLLEN